jgi:hypothetical protein
MGKWLGKGTECFWLLVLISSQSANAAPQVVGFGPAVRYVGVHGTYSFRVAAAGQYLHYQWWNQESDAQVGHAIPAELGFHVNSPRLVVTDAQDTRDYNGWYWCVVTDMRTGETATSPRGQCVVVGPPTFTQQPQSQSVTIGSAVSFSAAVDAHAPVPVRYQWFFNDRPIFGATRPTFSMAYARPARQGGYVCRAKTMGGTNYSSAAYLTVMPAQ